ncbi:hypothetical protein JHK82_026236 [Glycine max]|uniref:Remorin n=1 Tax=Glycine soja TaxID=3848 RepID=A0A445J6N6_GLYSO|nr:remorin-like [Glycine soja]KAG5008311.1 hypothetical protein JHK85_026853 [Glycine max]KAG5014101.1 hypothetical protein JHK86_026362 [Glycine max]KAG5135048.1 hypothetical protein JHK82_026236 [Glycine max]KAH1044902.1 hypothetical protein GYH30_026230 [Glycine max]KHN29375.1 Remorin [Glycine soja]
MPELQSKPETALAPAPVAAEVPSNDAVAKKASETGESKATVVASEKTPVPENKQSSRGSIDRDIALAEVEKEKKLSYVKAWEESEKAKAENRAQKQLSAIAAWENSKKATLEAELKKIEEQLEKKKAEHGERMKNKVALVHKEAEEKRAMIEANRCEEVLKTEEMAAKYRATGTTPKKTIGCF